MNKIDLSLLAGINYKTAFRLGVGLCVLLFLPSIEISSILIFCRFCMCCLSLCELLFWLDDTASLDLSNFSGSFNLSIFSSSKPKRYLPWISAMKGKICFYNGMSVNISATFPGTCPEFMYMCVLGGGGCFILYESIGYRAKSSGLRVHKEFL